MKSVLQWVGAATGPRQRIIIVIVSVLCLLQPCAGRVIAEQASLQGGQPKAIDIDSLLQTRTALLDSLASVSDSNAKFNRCVDRMLNLRQFGDPGVYWRYLSRNRVISEVFLSKDIELIDYNRSLIVLFRSDSAFYLAILTLVRVGDSLSQPGALGDSIEMHLDSVSRDGVVTFLRHAIDTYHLFGQPPFRDCGAAVMPSKHGFIGVNYGRRSSLLLWCNMPVLRGGVSLKGLTTFFDDAFGSSCPH